MYELTFLLGALLGAIIVWIFVAVITVSMQNRFRHYLLYQDDEKKKEIMGLLEAVKVELDELQKKTNEKYVRAKYNQFVDLLAFLRKRQMD